MNKLIIGLTGQIASGKGVAKKYIEEKYGATSFKFSDILRRILEDLDIPQTRDNVINLSIMLRQAYGEDLLARAMAKSVTSASQDIIVIDGIRRLADIEYLKPIPEFFVIAITAEPQLRYQRLIKRNENPGDAEKTWEDFLADENKETERSIAQVAAEADYHLDNNESLESLHAQIDKIILSRQNKQLK